MKQSLLPTGTGHAVPRLILLVLPTLLAGGMALGCGPQGTQAPQGPRGSPQPFSPSSPQAQQSPPSGLIGQWRTTVPPSTVQGIAVAGGTITISSGEWSIRSNGSASERQ